MNKALNEVIKRQLINSANTTSDASNVARIVKATLIGRAAGFLVNLRNKYREWKELKLKVMKIISKYLVKGEESYKYLLNKYIE